MERPRVNTNIWITLAGLRFFFAAWVLFDHTYNFGPADRAMPVWTKSGLVAVMCFFVISGFSIHHSISARPEGYGWRRFWRIAPTNALAVVIGWFAWSVLHLSGGYGTPPGPVPWWKFVGSLMLLECLVPVVIPFLFPAWSLSIEALYYCLAGRLKRLPGGAITLLAVVSGILFVAWPYIQDVYIAEKTYGIAAAALVWSWLAGWLAYGSLKGRVHFALFVIIGFAAIVSQSKFFAIVDLKSALANVLAWAGTLWVIYFRPSIRFGAASEKVLLYLGELSYPLYLLHYPVLFALTSSVLLKHPGWNYGIVHVIVAMAVAAVAYHTVDRPLRGGISLRRFRSKPA